MTKKIVFLSSCGPTSFTCVYAQSRQSCPTLCDPVDCSPLGSSVHGILQTRILKWDAMPYSKGSSRPRDQPGSPALQADAVPSEPPGKPIRY